MSDRILEQPQLTIPMVPLLHLVTGREGKFSSSFFSFSQQGFMQERGKASLMYYELCHLAPDKAWRKADIREVVWLLLHSERYQNEPLPKLVATASEIYHPGNHLARYPIAQIEITKSVYDIKPCYPDQVDKSTPFFWLHPI